MIDEAPLDFTPPAPAALPADEKSPIDFATAKGCTAHYASVAADTLEKYFRDRCGVASLSEVEVAVQRLLYAQRRLAKQSYDAATAEDWQRALAGGRNGSGLIGSLYIARHMVEAIINHDKRLPPGTDADACGDLSVSGLQKLLNGLGIATASIAQHTPQQRAFKPYFAFMPAVIIEETGRGIKHNAPSNLAQSLSRACGESVPSSEIWYGQKGRAVG